MLSSPRLAPPSQARLSLLIVALTLPSQGVCAQEFVAITPQSAGATTLSPRMCSIPDIDADGRDDLAIAVPFADDRVYVFSGQTSRLMYALRSPNPELFGDFGSSACGLSDIDGDGHGDIVVGAYGEGRAYVFSGARGTLIRTLTYSTPSGGAFGASCDAVRDLNNDGVNDILIGAPYELGETGLVYVFCGATGAELQRLDSPSPRPQGRFGTSVKGLADVDGDSFGDILIGAPLEGKSPQAADRGRAHVFSGASGAHLYSVDSPVAPALQFGHRLAAVSDLNFDGRGDFLVGVPSQAGASGERPNGRVFVFSGADGSLMRTIFSPFEQYVSGAFGGAMSEVPDLNADGVPELLIGDPAISPPNQPISSGLAFLFSGRDASLLQVFAPPRPRPDGNGAFASGVVCLAASSGRQPHLAFASQDCEGNCPPDPHGATYLFRPCPADLNLNGVAESIDFFQFVTRFFAGHADHNADGVTDTQDFFSFLDAFFQGCGDSDHPPIAEPGEAELG